MNQEPLHSPLANQRLINFSEAEAPLPPRENIRRQKASWLSLPMGIAASVIGGSLIIGVAITRSKDDKLAVVNTPSPVTATPAPHEPSKPINPWYPESRQIPATAANSAPSTNKNFPNLPSQNTGLPEAPKGGGFLPPDNAIIQRPGETDNLFLNDQAALPKEMRNNLIDGEITNSNTGHPGDEDRPVQDTATRVSPAQDPEFAERKKNLHNNELRFEPVALKIQHTLTALFPKDAATPPQKIRLDVPVIHESQTLALTGAEIETARVLLEQVREHQKRMQDLQEESANLLRQWNDLQRRGGPESILLPDSPSLVDNQHTEDITGETGPLSGTKSSAKTEDAVPKATAVKQ